MKLKSFGRLLLSIAISQSAGLIGTLFTFSAIPTWYAYLNKPSFAPPNWVFGPVWTTLYALMGISIVLILEKKISRRKKNMALILFGLQLFLNFLWSVVFFGGHQLLLSIFIIVFLWLSILSLIIMFKKISNFASLLLVPYLAWVSFASLLNISIFVLNR
jgi:tryptophan-rich sensory protein